MSFRVPVVSRVQPCERATPVDLSLFATKAPVGASGHWHRARQPPRGIAFGSAQEPPCRPEAWQGGRLALVEVDEGRKCQSTTHRRLLHARGGQLIKPPRTAGF